MRNFIFFHNLNRKYRKSIILGQERKKTAYILNQQNKLYKTDAKKIFFRKRARYVIYRNMMSKIYVLGKKIQLHKLDYKMTANIIFEN
jgi:hypothetical protein